MDKIQARLIAEKFAAGICSPAEHEALFNWILSLPAAERRTLVEDYSQIFEIRKDVPANLGLWEKLAQKLDEPQSEPQEKLPAKIRSLEYNTSKYKWMFAAASILILFAAGVFFFVNNRPAPPIAQLTRHDLPPGGYKATLTLGDGTVISLDSAKNGQLALQGSTEISKVANGQLAYNLSKNVSPATDNSAPTYNIINTPKGGQYQLSLPDGSKVWLNSASSLKFPTVFNGDKREVELTGEGYFEIEKNERVPFTVSVGKMKVQVLGTGFNIMAYGDERTINTTLLQGAVNVFEGDLSKMLIPGQQAALNASTHQLDVEQADIRKTMAWKNGVFEFDNTDVAAIMRQLARWYDIDVHYVVAPNQAKLGGSISRSQNLSEVLNVLEANSFNHFTIEGKQVNVLP